MQNMVGKNPWVDLIFHLPRDTVDPKAERYIGSKRETRFLHLKWDPPPLKINQGMIYAGFALHLRDAAKLN